MKYLLVILGAVAFFLGVVLGAVAETRINGTVFHEVVAILVVLVGVVALGFGGVIFAIEGRRS